MNALNFCGYVNPPPNRIINKKCLSDIITGPGQDSTRPIVKVGKRPGHRHLLDRPSAPVGRGKHPISWINPQPTHDYRSRPPPPEPNHPRATHPKRRPIIISMYVWMFYSQFRPPPSAPVQTPPSHAPKAPSPWPRRSRRGSITVSGCAYQLIDQQTGRTRTHPNEE